MIKAIAFDIDGTLYKTFYFSIRCIPFALKNARFMVNFGIVRKELRKVDVNTTLKNDFFYLQAELLSKRLGWELDYTKNFIDEKIYHGWKKLFKNVKPYKNAVEVIRAFKNEGFKIGILSDFPPYQKNDIWGIKKLCDVIIGSEYCGVLKPNKKPFLQLASQLNLKPSEIMYVGNSYRYDILGAKNAGMKTAMICNPIKKLFVSKKADIVFSNYTEFYKKFGRSALNY